MIFFFTPSPSRIRLFGRSRRPQPNLFNRIPVGVWFLAGLILGIMAVMWALREKREREQVETGLATVPAGALPEEAEAAPEAPLPVPAPTPLPKPDDLTKIKGIGPKIKQVLYERGIQTFEQLAEMKVGALQQLMEEQQWHMATFESWPAQARELAEEKSKKHS